MDITIIDPQYTEWIRDLSLRYRKSQIKAAAKVNGEMLRFYWSLGHDIALWKAEARWGSKFFKNLSADLKRVMPEATCFSETNLKYMKYYYEMFPLPSISPQVEDESTATAISPWQKITLEGTSLPVAISEYELQQIYPENVEGTVPSIKEIEAALNIAENLQV